MDTTHNKGKSQSAFRRLRLLPNRETFTPQEVRRHLVLDPGADPRTATVHDAAARTGIWANLLPEKVATELGRAGTRLPTIVYWHVQGVPAAEIGRRVSPFGDAWDAERALNVAAALIAHTLNRRASAEAAA
jgi:hypothetical protein